VIESCARLEAHPVTRCAQPENQNPLQASENSPPARPISRVVPICLAAELHRGYHLCPILPSALGSPYSIDVTT
jgi:hypothetical protein